MTMLNELKSIDYPLDKDGLSYFIETVIGDNVRTSQDVEVLCSHTPASLRIVANDYLRYCLLFGWVVEEDGYYHLSNEIIESIRGHSSLNQLIVDKTVNRLFQEGLFSLDMFEYESVLNKFRFRNELFDINYSAVRDTLTNQGFFESIRQTQTTRFYVSDTCLSLIENSIRQQKKTLTLDDLRLKLEQEEAAGDLAEQFVLSYELKRLNGKEGVKRISTIDVSAGYDIVSYDSQDSAINDLFIEVKAINKSHCFYMSSNEMDVAKWKGNSYCLYLVYLPEIQKPDYKPIIIRNPINSFSTSNDWLIEPKSFQIQLLKTNS